MIPSLPLHHRAKQHGTSGRLAILLIAKTFIVHARSPHLHFPDPVKHCTCSAVDQPRVVVSGRWAAQDNSIGPTPRATVAQPVSRRSAFFPSRLQKSLVSHRPAKFDWTLRSPAPVPKQGHKLGDRPHKPLVLCLPHADHTQQKCSKCPITRGASGEYHHCYLVLGDVLGFRQPRTNTLVSLLSQQTTTVFRTLEQCQNRQGRRLPDLAAGRRWPTSFVKHNRARHKVHKTRGSTCSTRLTFLSVEVDAVRGAFLQSHRLEPEND
ncbi:hypothetical protein VTK26DRAFT_7079 [Humicola hyalothermophila]